MHVYSYTLRSFNSSININALLVGSNIPYKYIVWIMTRHDMTQQCCGVFDTHICACCLMRHYDMSVDEMIVRPPYEYAQIHLDRYVVLPLSYMISAFVSAQLFVYI